MVLIFLKRPDNHRSAIPYNKNERLLNNSKYSPYLFAVERNCVLMKPIWWISITRSIATSKTGPFLLIKYR